VTINQLHINISHVTTNTDGPRHQQQLTDLYKLNTVYQKIWYKTTVNQLSG